MANHTYCIELIEGDHDYLLSLSKNRTIQAQIVERAKILLQKEAGKPDKSVAEWLCIDVSTFYEDFARPLISMGALISQYSSSP